MGRARRSLPLPAPRRASAPRQTDVREGSNRDPCARNEPSSRCCSPPCWPPRCSAPARPGRRPTTRRRWPSSGRTTIRSSPSTAGPTPSTRRSTGTCWSRWPRGYRAVVPAPVRTGIRNVLANLRTPVILVNDILQGEPRRAGDTLGRFLVNSTLGRRRHLRRRRHAHGRARAHGGFRPDLRALGHRRRAVPVHPDPRPVQPARPDGLRRRHRAPTRCSGSARARRWTCWSAPAPARRWWTPARICSIPSTQVERTSLDPYATLRSAYRQRRRAEIENRTGGGPPVRLRDRLRRRPRPAIRARAPADAARRPERRRSRHDMAPRRLFLGTVLALPPQRRGAPAPRAPTPPAPRSSSRPPGRNWLRR